MKIPALRIEVNGHLVAIAGAKDLSMLTGTVGLGAGENANINASNILLSVMGLALHGDQPQQLSWCKNISLQAGDRVTFQVVEVEQPSSPDQTLRSPSTSELSAEASGSRRKRGKQ
jgi:hypothetical protein